MPTGLSAAGFVVLGIALTFVGAMCAGAVPGHTWVSRVATVLIVTSIPALGFLFVPRAQGTERHVLTPCDFAIATLDLLPMFAILAFYLTWARRPLPLGRG